MSSDKDIKKKDTLKEMIFDLIKINSISFFYVTFTIIFAIIIGLLVAILITYPFGLNEFASGSTDGWLGFWGGLIGGLLGTVAVLIVAAWQNKVQSKMLDMQIQEQKKENKLTRQLEINKVKREELYNYIRELEEVSADSKEYIRNIILLIDYLKAGTTIPKGLLQRLNNQIEIMTDNYERIELLYSTLGFKEGHDLGRLIHFDVSEVKDYENDDQYEKLKQQYIENHSKLFKHISYVRQHIRDMNNFNL